MDGLQQRNMFPHADLFCCLISDFAILAITAFARSSHRMVSSVAAVAAITDNLVQTIHLGFPEHLQMEESCMEPTKLGRNSAEQVIMLQRRVMSLNESSQLVVILLP